MSTEGGLREIRPVLGLKSSCDETAAAVLRADGTILAEAVLSQEAEHAPYGGVVPEIAARAHLDHLPRLAQRVMAQAGLGFEDLGGMAATSGPGLIGGLIVGASFGKGLAIAHGLPFVAVNHLEAHALTARLPGLLPEGPARFPYLLMLLSGGHCQCVAVEGLGRYRRLGTTLDDAVGEAFDKAAKLLGLPWPGGPALERLAASRRPRPLRPAAAAAGPAGLRLLLQRSQDRRRACRGEAAAPGGGRPRRHRGGLPGRGGGGDGGPRRACPGRHAGCRGAGGGGRRRRQCRGAGRAGAGRRRRRACRWWRRRSGSARTMR